MLYELTVSQGIFRSEQSFFMHCIYTRKIMLIIYMGIVWKISTPTKDKKYKIVLDTCQHSWSKRERCIKIFVWKWQIMIINLLNLIWHGDLLKISFKSWSYIYFWWFFGWIIYKNFLSKFLIENLHYTPTL